MPIDRGTQFGLLAFIGPTTLARLASRIPTIPPARWGRLAGIGAASLAGAPLTAIEALGNGAALANTEVHPEPVFIIGHWRSGTTHLHNLMSKDAQFGHLQMYEAIAPNCAKTSRNWLAPLLSRLMPTKRPMDNLHWPMDAPQEEEIPLAKLTPYSWYLQFLFPQQALETFQRYVLLEGAPASARQEVSSKLTRLMQIATQHHNGKRLLLKNPVNTARIPLLLKQFPKAKFVFLHRSPYEVLPSTINLHRKILELTSLQNYDEQLIENNVLKLYPALIDRYLKDKELLEPNQLVEVGFNDLERDPMAVIERIYSKLEIPGYAAAQAPMQSYVDTLGGYQKNEFKPLDTALVAAMESQWQAGFKHWGYLQPNEIPHVA